MNKSTARVTTAKPSPPWFQVTLPYPGGVVQDWDLQDYLGI